MNLVNLSKYQHEYETEASNADMKATVEDQFQYHPWSPEQVEAGNAVRQALAAATIAILENVPPSADRSTALRKIREARMDANSAITHKGKY